jgi:hypothetical protein
MHDAHKLQCASHLNLGHVIQVINEGDPDPDPITPPPPVTRPPMTRGPTSGSQRVKAISLMPLVVLLALKLAHF